MGGAGDIVCHKCMGENDIIHDQSLRKYSYKKSKVEVVTKLDYFFTIC